MLRVAGIILALVGALALVGCGSDSKAKGDKGVTLGDSGPPTEGGLFPDYGSYDYGQPTEGGTGTTCVEIMNCIATCGQSDQACMNACVAAGTADAQAKFQALLTCMNNAMTGSCSADCADPSSQACIDCVAQACTAETQACQGGGTATGSNSGAICNSTTACPDMSEGCFQLNPSSQNGMCLGKCQTSGDNCQVSDAATQLSKCNIQEQTTGDMYCAWFCEVSGQTYSCPNATDYGCQVLDPNQPTLKFCVPK
jgi:hypothetical protein